MDEFNQKKSLLRNKQVQELKTVEKELKKKKGALREQIELRRDDMLHRHQKELEELAASCGTKGDKHEEYNPNSPVECGLAETYYFPDHNWSSLGKKDLETEAHKRGLGKKGNREELVTKLVIFHNEQKIKVSKGQLNPKNTPPSDKTNKKHRNTTGIRKVTDSSIFAANPSDKIRQDVKKIDVCSETSSSSSGSDDEESDDQESDDEDSDDEDSDNEDRDNDNLSIIKQKLTKNSNHQINRTDKTNIIDEKEKKENEVDPRDIPDMQQLTGSFKQDARGAQRRNLNKSRPSKGRGRGRGSVRNEEPTELTDEERQRRREKVMQQVLVKLMEKNAKGIQLDQLTTELKIFKVTNFQPSLLGYNTVEEWIVNQPPNILHYDTKHKCLLPARVTSLPTNYSEEDDSD